MKPFLFDGDLDSAREGFLKHKAVLFKEAHPTLEEHKKLLALICHKDENEKMVEHGWRAPPSNFEQEIGYGVILNEDHGVLLNDGEHYNGVPLEDGVAPEFLNLGWHIDFPFRETPPAITSIHMKKFDVPPQTGGTWLMDLEEVLISLPSELQEWLSDKKIFHLQETLQQLAYVKDWTFGRTGALHPAVRTHPATNNLCLFWSGWTCEFEDLEDDNTKRVKEIMKGFFMDVFENDDNSHLYYRHEWSEGDLLIWDNRNALHTFEGGWTIGSRVFDKIEYGYEKPS